jgi:ribosomal protein S18 acetylase RimI-like enzyme
MTIRTLVEADLARIKEIDRAIFPPEEQYDDATYQSMTQTELSVVAMGSNGQLVGYAFVQRPQDWPWLRESDLIAEPRIYPGARARSIAVHPDDRRQGYARAMLRFVTDKAVDLVDLLVDQENIGALTLYQSVGFEQAQPCPRDPPKLRLVLAPRNSKMARRGFLSVDGVRLAYAAFGGVGPPALLLHGLYGKAAEWRSTAGWLMKSHEVFALDQRGHGQSDKSLSDFFRGAQVNDAIVLIEALDRGPVLSCTIAATAPEATETA